MKETIIEAFTHAIMVADESVINEVKELCIKLGFIKEDAVVAAEVDIATDAITTSEIVYDPSTGTAEVGTPSVA